MRASSFAYFAPLVLSSTLVTGCDELAGGDLDASASGGDGSAELADGGPGDPDGASGAPDAAPLPDGATATDGGGSPIDTACSSICDKADTCLGGVGADCATECASDLPQLGCSASELSDLQDCAGVSCESFEGCVLSIPCLDGGGGCGDGTCDGSEDCASCPGDCGACACGDNVCSPGECSSCAADCPDGCHCADVCEIGPAQDPSCGDCVKDICAADPYCCQTEWDSVCTGEAESICGKDCPGVPPPPPLDGGPAPVPADGGPAPVPTDGGPSPV